MSHIWQSDNMYIFTHILPATNLSCSYFAIYPYCLWMCSLASFIPNSIRKLTVSYSDTFKRLIKVPQYTCLSLAFSMNLTDHINVVFRKSAHSLMSRVTTSSNSIVTAIVNSDAYQQSPLMDKWEYYMYVNNDV